MKQRTLRRQRQLHEALRRRQRREAAEAHERRWMRTLLLYTIALMTVVGSVAVFLFSGIWGMFHH